MAFFHSIQTVNEEKTSSKGKREWKLWLIKSFWSRCRFRITRYQEQERKTVSIIIGFTSSRISFISVWFVSAMFSFKWSQAFFNFCSMWQPVDCCGYFKNKKSCITRFSNAENYTLFWQHQKCLRSWTLRYMHHLRFVKCWERFMLVERRVMFGPIIWLIDDEEMIATNPPSIHEIISVRTFNESKI